MITLNRSGKPPLFTTGKCVFSACSKRPIKGRDRYHKVNVWECADGFACAITYVSDWPGEHCHYHAFTAPTASRLADELAAYDPTAYVIGFPAMPKYAERQRQLLVDIRMRYENLVSDVLVATLAIASLEGSHA